MHFNPCRPLHPNSHSQLRWDPPLFLMGFLSFFGAVLIRSWVKPGQSGHHEIHVAFSALKRGNLLFRSIPFRSTCGSLTVDACLEGGDVAGTIQKVINAQPHIGCCWGRVIPSGRMRIIDKSLANPSKSEPLSNLLPSFTGWTSISIS